MKMKQNIDEILIAPGDLCLPLSIQWYDFICPVKTSHSGQVHQHDTWIQTCETVVWMTSKSIVPADVGNFVLGRHGSKLRRVELFKEVPDSF